MATKRKSVGDNKWEFMFSGIIEGKSRVETAIQRDEVVELHIVRPRHFNDLSIGDSIAVNGICLTVESFSTTDIQFAVAYETLKVTGWKAKTLQGLEVNLERSLRFGDRIHGHIVTGHVDAVGQIDSVQLIGENFILKIRFDESLRPFIWRKGSVALDGVSLTINEVTDQCLEVCLIPETLKRTNLGSLQRGDAINIEVDAMARGLVRNLNLREANQEVQL